MDSRSCKASNVCKWVLALTLMSAASTTNAADWSLEKETLTNVCHVLKTTASPLGKTLSEHATRILACKEAKRLYDVELTDENKCWAYGGGTRDGCRKDGVLLDTLAKKINSTSIAFKLRRLSATNASIKQADIQPFIIGGVLADPKKFPATLLFDGQCTATIIGRRSIVTVAHCVDNGATGTVLIDGKNFGAVCAHHPAYTTPSECSKSMPPLTCAADIALCKTNVDLTAVGLKYEVVQTDRTKLATGQTMVLLGYGCTTTGGPAAGVLYAGSSKVGALSNLQPTSFNDHFMKISGPTLVCKGDSGAGNFDVADSATRSVIGVTARADAATSYLVQTTDTRISNFMKTWSNVNAAPICGISSTAQGCR